jgi:CheY-like chemotaxis protein
MANADAATLAQQMMKLGLVNEAQLQEGWEAVGHKTTDPLPLLRALEHLGHLTRFQSDKLLKGDVTGYVLGGYRLLYKIASGSFGRVYRSDDPQTGRVVAIKVLRKRWSDDEHAIGLFEREGRVGLSLQHPNIVEVLAVSQDPITKQYYIVMEFVEGGNLREFLAIRKKLQPSEALRLIEDAVSGIAHAYARGVTHRDMKLTNVLISSQGAAKLVDFGLAGIFSRKGLELDGGEKVDRTVDYAGLEKATAVKPGDVRSDIYFLGCILYEMLTGRPPLVMSRDPRVRMDPHRFDRVPPMKSEDVTAPPSVFQLVERMMSLDPKLRYQTPSQLLDAVRSARQDLDAPPVELKPGLPLAGPAARTVFVVERDERLQNAVRNKFKELGYRVLLAADPARAIERFRQQPYDALVLDAGTTGEEGRYVFERIVAEAERQALGFSGILILKGDQADWAEEIQPAPHVAVLIKPTLKQVYQKLQELVPAPAKVAVSRS